MADYLQNYLPVYFSQFAHFHFLRPWWFLGLIPLLWTLRYLWLARNSMGKWNKVIAPHLLAAMRVRPRRASWFNPVSAGVIVLLISIVALAGPSWKQQPTPFTEDIAGLVVMLDVSSSMQQTDIQPSRLERAKLKIKDLISLRGGGRIGLIVYAGSAHSVIPLTNDLDVLNNFLDAIVIDIMPRRGKFPEKALPIAQTLLDDSPVWARVPGTVLMMGDGLSPRSLEDFSVFFKDHAHQLLVWGVGSEGAEPDKIDSAFMPLESTVLKALARRSGGYYQKLTLDKDDVKNINRRINNSIIIVEDQNRPWMDAGYYLIFPIALMMLLWFRKGWTLRWCFALFIVSGLVTPPAARASDTANLDLAGQFMALWLTPDQQGQYYLKQGHYKKAAAHFDNIAWRGVAYYRGGNFKAATEMFLRIESVDGYFNLANAWAHNRDYVLAVKTYNQVLELEPGHRGALKNRQKIQAIIDQINLLSASQKAEESDSSKDLGEDEPQTAEGVERSDFVERELEQLSAEDVLLDEQINELWMRQVQKDPSRFLKVKFYMQVQREENHSGP